MKLGDLCGSETERLTVATDQLIDYIDISSVSNESKSIIGKQTLKSREAPSRAQRILKSNDILVSTVRPNLNAVAVYDGSFKNLAVASTGFCVLRCKPGVNHRFIFNICKSRAFIKALVEQATGASYPAVNEKIIRAFEFPDVTYECQEEVAARLDTLQRIIDLRKQQLRELDDLIKARFVEMFGDININDKGWDVQPLGELCTIVRGGSPRPIEQFLGGDIPWIKIGDATEGESIYLNSTKEHIIQEGIKKSRLVKEGSLIFANCGVSLGFARIITFDGCIHDGWLAMEDIDSSLNKIFLLQTLNQMTDHFRKIAPAGTQPNLNTAIMKSYKQIIPPMKLQNDFIDFVSQIDKSKVVAQKAIDEAKLLLDSLMQKYFG